MEANFNFVDRIAALIHDLEKPSTKSIDNFGHVNFDGHEEKITLRVPTIANIFDLSVSEKEKLTFLVSNHGLAHNLPKLEDAQKKKLICWIYWRNLRILQKADAVSCFLNKDGSKHLPSWWNIFVQLESKFK